MEALEIVNTNKVLDVKYAVMDGSKFVCVCAEQLYMENVSLAKTKITDANLSDLEIDGAQLGGAYIHNIGLPPEGHPHHEPNAKQRPIRFENCNLNDSTIIDCNLSNVEINDCNISGLKINGILIEELINEYAKNPK